MSKEIVEAVHVLEREKGISSERLMEALEDALLSAYKKTPGAAKYARVDMDRGSADFKVFELLIPPELEDKLLAEVEPEEPTVDPETGELREPVEALLPKSEQVDNERYDHGQRIKAVITDVSAQAKGPSIIVSRRSPELIRKLFELEVPEIADGLVEVQNVAREPGYRSKIAVVSHASGVDPVGACVGPRGSRVRMVVSELRGEKIDIIPFNEEPARFVAKALSPARVREVLVDDANKQATVVVPDDQLSLAIGKEGQNARLAARLTGGRGDIRPETEVAAEGAHLAFSGTDEDDEVGGRCAALLSS